MELELVYPYTVTLLPAIVGRFNTHASPLLKDFEEYHLQFTSVIPLFFFYSYISKFLSDLQGQPLPLLKLFPLLMPRFASRSTSHESLTIYMDTTVVVLMSYLSLLNINLSYIWLAIFPSITLAFIAALLNDELRGGRSSYAVSELTVAKKDGLLELKAMAVVPYWVLCAMGQFHGGDSFAVSQFFLFLGSTLGALSLMAARLSGLTGAATGLVQASEILRRAALVVLLVTAHAVAAELLGDDAVVMLCLPELAPVLLWFSLHLYRGGSSAFTIENVGSHRNVLFVLVAAVAAVMAYLVATMDERGLSACAMALVSCGVSGILVYCAVLVLCQWPGQAATAATAPLMEVVWVLKFWENTLLAVAATLVVLASLTVFRLGLHEPMFATVVEQFRDSIERFPQLVV
uniref:Uncharacterized protein n=1 Tax=Leersia perrieri TaxID=77586 RepID=A0A0D9V0M3_9ORYZ